MTRDNARTLANIAAFVAIAYALVSIEAANAGDKENKNSDPNSHTLSAAHNETNGNIEADRLVDALQKASRNVDEAKKSLDTMPEDTQRWGAYSQSLEQVEQAARQLSGLGEDVIVSHARLLADAYAKSPFYQADAAAMYYICAISGMADIEVGHMFSQVMSTMEANVAAAQASTAPIRLSRFLLPHGQHDIRDADIASWRAMRTFLEQNSSDLPAMFNAKDSNIQFGLRTLAARVLRFAGDGRRGQPSASPSLPKSSPLEGLIPSSRVKTQADEETIIQDILVRFAKAPNSMREIDSVLNMLSSHRIYLRKNHPHLPNLPEIAKTFGGEGEPDPLILDLFYRTMVFGDYDARLDDVKGLSTRIEDPRLRYLEAYLLIELNRHDEAKTRLDEMTRLYPDEEKASQLLNSVSASKAMR